MTNIKLPQSFFFEAGPKAVLLLHAYTGSANDVRMLGRNLQRAGYTVYAPNFTGHATERFEDILDLGNPEKWLQDVKEATAFLKEKGYGEIAVFGLSMGGIMATRALETDSYVGGGSFNSPIMHIGDSKVPAAFVNYYRNFNKRLGMSKEEIESNMPRVKQKMNDQLDAITEFSNEVIAELEKIRVPYYIASSGKDELIDSKNGAVLRDALNPYTEVDYNDFPEMTHVITVGANREPFEASVEAFLEKLNWKEG